MSSVPQPAPPHATSVRTYSAETARHTLVRGLLPVLHYPQLLWEHRYLVQNFFRRDLLGRFRGSALGIVWVLIHPIFLFTIYYLVFGYLFGGGRADPKQPPDPRFALYLFSGVIVFTSLTEGLGRACTCVVDNGNLVKKVAFPSELLPVPVILIAQMVYLVGAAVCLVVGISAGALQPGWALLALPLVVVVQFVFTLGLGLLLASLQVFARDTSQLWGIFATAWMFLTPVFWFPFQLEQTLGSGLGTLLAWNPAYPLLQAHRIVLGATDFTVGDRHVGFGALGEHLLHAAGWALFFLFLGHALFHSRRHKFADLV